MRPWTGRLVVCASAVLIALGGCGSDDTKEKNAYVDEVQTVIQRYENRLSALQDNVEAVSTPARSRRTLDALDAETRRAGRDLARIRAPAPVRRLHAQLTREVAGYRTVIARVRTGLLSADEQAVLRARSTYSTQGAESGRRIARTIVEINRVLRS